MKHLVCLGSLLALIACTEKSPPRDTGDAAAVADAVAPQGPDAPEPPGDGVPPITHDPFGVRMIYPTIADGREWYLPENGDVATDEWAPDQGGRGKLERTDEEEVFHMRGSPRLPVKSPDGKAWFRNIEMTGYFRLIEALPEGERESPTDACGWQFLVRGERHTTSSTVAGSSINDGIAPPAGTATWPWYPQDSSVNAHCLATSLHGYVEVDGRTRFKKEISHTGGYSDARETAQAFEGGVPMNAWFGYKLVVRNQGEGAVHMEAWVDLAGDGNWQRVGQTADTGDWDVGSTNLDGCAEPPYLYTQAQLITWAGPWVLFRFDNIDCDVKWLSVREIAPLS